MEREIVGTVIGSATPLEFRLAVRPGRLSVQDFVTVDGEDGTTIWARVLDVQRINPLFPTEAAQELAFQGMDAYDTVAALSRELITARCRILGVATTAGMQPLAYPVRPAASAYRPDTAEATELLAGGMPPHRRLHLGHLRGYTDVPVYVDAQAIVARHLAVLAATGGGKSVAVRRLVEQLAAVGSGYPMVLLDPHGDYLGLKDLWPGRVQIYLAALDLLHEPVDAVVELVASLSGEELTGPQEGLLVSVLYLAQNDDRRERLNELVEAAGGGPHVPAPRPDFLGWCRSLVRLVGRLVAQKQGPRLGAIDQGFHVNDAVPAPLARKLAKAAARLAEMERMSRDRAKGVDAASLPAGSGRRKLVQPGQISIVSLEGYTDNVRQGLVASVLRTLLNERIDGKVPRFLTVVEEAHNFVPARGEQVGERSSSLPVLKRIATEGRKYGMGLVFVSQRPSRLDPTVLSQCNSFLVLRIVNPTDQQYIRDVVETMGADDSALLPSLGIGEALLSGQFVGTPTLVKVEKGSAQGRHEEEDFLKDLLE